MININYFAKKMNGAQNDGGIPIVNREEIPVAAKGSEMAEASLGVTSRGVMHPKHLGYMNGAVKRI